MRSARSPKPMPPEAEARWSRYKLAVRMAGMTDAGLARVLKLKHRSQLSQVITSQAAGVQLWPRIAKALKVDHGWLYTGSGDSPAWASTPITISRKEPFAEALTLLGTVMKSVSEEGRRRDLKVDGALEALEAARMAIERL